MMMIPSSLLVMKSFPSSRLSLLLLLLLHFFCPNMKSSSIWIMKSPGGGGGRWFEEAEIGWNHLPEMFMMLYMKRYCVSRMNKVSFKTERYSYVHIYTYIYTYIHTYIHIYMTYIYTTWGLDFQLRSFHDASYDATQPKIQIQLEMLTFSRMYINSLPHDSITGNYSTNHDRYAGRIPWNQSWFHHCQSWWNHHHKGFKMLCMKKRDAHFF